MGKNGLTREQVELVLTIAKMVVAVSLPIWAALSAAVWRLWKKLEDERSDRLAELKEVLKEYRDLCIDHGKLFERIELHLAPEEEE